MINFIKTINTLRKNNKSNWYTWQWIVDWKIIQLKWFETWLQIFKVDWIDYSNSMYSNVTDFKHDLEKPFINN